MPIPDPPSPTQRREQHRADFIRRLFAVAVSVGFANQIIGMTELKAGNPTAAELEHLAYLAVGLYLIVQSWEFYFLSIEKKAAGPATFSVDVKQVAATFRHPS